MELHLTPHFRKFPPPPILEEQTVRAMGKPPSFVCSTCSKAFTRKDYLSRHEVNHTDIKPFKCEHCKLGFTRSDLLGKHFKLKLHQRALEHLATATSQPAKRPADQGPTGHSPEKKKKPPSTDFLGREQPPPQPGIIYPPESHVQVSEPVPELLGGFIDNILWFFNDSLPVGELDILDTVPGDPGLDPAAYFDIRPLAYDHVRVDGSVRIQPRTRQTVLETFQTVQQLSKISLARFEDFLNLYWFNFGQTFPIIHEPTFDPNACDVYLLVSMLVIGMAHLHDAFEYDLLVALNKEFRRLIRKEVDEEISLPLSRLQAMVLHNFSSKNFGDMRLNQLAQIDHGPNILYLRFSGLLDNLTEPLLSRTKNMSLDELDQQWRTWIHYESCKRLVLFEFICDTQHVTFSKLELLPAFDIKLELPCTDQVWSATSALSFFEDYADQPRGWFPRPRLNVSVGRGYNAEIGSQTSQNDSGRPVISESVKKHPPATMLSRWPSFLWSLKSLMLEYRDGQREYSMNCYLLFLRYILLHGLMRVCWDMRSQGLLDLGIVSKKKLHEFFKKLERGFIHWKAFFDCHVRLYEDQTRKRAAGTTTGDPKPTLSRLGSSTALAASHIFMNNYGRTNASWANLSFYYTGLFTLYADVPSITKFASEYNWPIKTGGAYRDPQQAEHERTKAIVEQWARLANGAFALVESCRFLALVYDHEETINTFSHVPGTAYLAALMIWCYEINRDSPSVGGLRGKKELDETQSIHPGLDLCVERYFGSFGTVKYETAREDSSKYFEAVLNSETIEAHENDQEKRKKKPAFRFDGKAYEDYSQRQLRTVGVVCYVLHLLRGCKWKYSVDLVQRLEGVVQSYEK